VIVIFFELRLGRRISSNYCLPAWADVLSNLPWQPPRITAFWPPPLAATGCRPGSSLRRETDVTHEQRIDAGAAERGDRMGRRAYDRLTVVERRVEDERHAGSREEA
jgi:hypothetical protein